MKLKKEFITHNVGDTQMMVSASSDVNAFHGMVKSNETAAFIVDHLKESTTQEDIVKALLNEYDVDENTANKAVEYVIDKLKSINAIDFE